MKIWREAFSGRKHKNLLWFTVPYSAFLLIPSGQSSVISSITHVGMGSAMLGETAWRAIKGKPGCPAGKALGHRVKSLSWPCQQEYCLQQRDATPCVGTDTETEEKSQWDGDWELFWQSKQGLNLELFQGKIKAGAALVHTGGQRGGLWVRLWSMTQMIWPWFLPCSCVTLPSQCLPPNKMWVLTQTCFYVLLCLY